MAYSSPATVSDGNVAPATWGNSVKAATDYLANPPACKANRTTNQTISHNTDTAVALADAESYDTATMHDLVTNSTRVTVPAAGLYVCTFNCSWATSGTAMIAKLRVNGATGYNSVRADGSGTLNQLVSDVIKLAAGDYVEGVVFQFSGGNLTLSSGSLSVVWMGLG